MLHVPIHIPQVETHSQTQNCSYEKRLSKVIATQKKKHALHWQTKKAITPKNLKDEPHWKHQSMCASRQECSKHIPQSQASPPSCPFANCWRCWGSARTGRCPKPDASPEERTECPKAPLASKTPMTSVMSSPFVSVPPLSCHVCFRTHPLSLSQYLSLSLALCLFLSGGRSSGALGAYVLSSLRK